MKRSKTKKQKDENNLFIKLKILVFLLIALLLIDIDFNITASKINMSKKQIINNKFELKPLTNVIKHGNRNKKEIAITFDADMTNDMYYSLQNEKNFSFYNKQVIDLLIKENIKATIFFAGLWTKAYPIEAKKIAQNILFEVGNHSFSHPAFTNNCYSLPFIENEFNYKEIKDAQDVIMRNTGVLPKVFRFPGGCFDKEDLLSVSSFNLNTIHWDVVSQDAFNNNESAIVENVIKNVKNGSIIVMHLNYGHYAPKTYEALIQIIPQLKKRGYKFVKVSELISNNHLL